MEDRERPQEWRKIRGELPRHEANVKKVVRGKRREIRLALVA